MNFLMGWLVRAMRGWIGGTGEGGAMEERGRREGGASEERWEGGLRAIETLSHPSTHR